MFDRRKFLFALGSLGLISGSSLNAKSALDSSKPSLPASALTNSSINDLEDVTITTPTNGQTLSFRNNTWINVAENYLRLEDFGGIADGITDNSAAIQAALNVLKAAHGGTLVFPRGVTKITKDTYVDFLDKQGAVRFVGSGSDSVIHIATGGNVTFSIANGTQFIVENLTFIGTQGDSALVWDVTQSVFFCSYVEQVTFRDCKFLGIGINPPYDDHNSGINNYHGIVSVNQGDLLVDRCYFGGCVTNQCANVNVTSWNALTVRDCQFIDYGFYNGVEISKTGYATNLAWVRALYQNVLDNARCRGKVTIERTSFDEGTFVGVFVNQATWVEIDNISANNGLAEAVSLRDVSHTTIKDSFVGYTNNDTALFAYNCKTIEVENLILGGNVKYLKLQSGAPKLFVKYSTLPGGLRAANGVINNSRGTVEIKNY